MKDYNKKTKKVDSRRTNLDEITDVEQLRKLAKYYRKQRDKEKYFAKKHMSDFNELEKEIISLRDTNKVNKSTIDISF